MNRSPGEFPAFREITGKFRRNRLPDAGFDMDFSADSVSYDEIPCKSEQGIFWANREFTCGSRDIFFGFGQHPACGERTTEDAAGGELP